jgi:DNA-binding response OmpR family regulator
MKLLVIDDDMELCSMLRDFLQDVGFVVDFEADGIRGLARTQSEAYDLLILDVMLPGADGFQVLQRIRWRSQLPVLMLTAKSAPSDRVLGFELGADDYLAKPFHPEELLARVRAILRRIRPPTAEAPEVIEVGELRIEPGTRNAYFRGRPLDLTAMECEILEQLARYPGRVVSRDQLCLRLYDRPASPFDRSVDTHVSRIRRKMGDGRGLIMSVRGSGYQLRCPPAADSV